ncbi:KilA-N domain-containing protein [Schlesneria sp. DSM 10557]|uniref:KilA-N domain-containing protein n=1 Tax=Schlesneria sp. DSM 10557 TaxID=3044399 RepID=UPI0035A138A0
MSAPQLHLALITHEVEATVIHQRAVDGYVNATAMCSACGKALNVYSRLTNTIAFLDELSSETGIPVSELVITRKGRSPLEQGTWVHPHVAINLGQWCSPKFAVAVSRWVQDWVTGKYSTNGLPFHIRRYIANMSGVPTTHFSMLNELTFGLVAPLEQHGYTLPETLVPDISTGLMFCKWLRRVKGVDPSLFPKYSHRYEDGRIVEATLYPLYLLADFRDYFFNVWIPQKMVGYFKQRDPKALTYMPMAFPALYGAQGKKLVGP